MKLSDIKTICTTLDAGMWIGDIPLPGFEGVRLQVRGARNPDYQQLYGQLVAALPREKRRMDTIDPVENDRMVCECLRKTVLLGWEGIDDAYSPESIATIFDDPMLRGAFKDAIVWAANKAADQAADSLEADVKN